MRDIYQGRPGMAGMTSVSVRGLFELTRPINAVAAGVLTATGSFLAGGLFPAPTATGAAAGATICATGAGNAINDYFDREIDRINRPDRPIPRGAVSPRMALGFSLVLFAVAVVLALTLPALAIAIAAINLLLLIAYTEVFKGLPGVGNAVVAALGGSTFLFGGAAVGDVVAPGVLFVLAALSTFTREVIKDVEDLAGDREEGLDTLPITIGERPALWFATACLVVAVLASPLPYLLGELGVVYLLMVAPANAVMLAAAATSFDDPAAGQRRLKYGMFLAALAFVLGRIALVAGG